MNYKGNNSKPSPNESPSDTGTLVASPTDYPSNIITDLNMLDEENNKFPVR
jgi:hypothetical protein